jgi:RNA polymerase sigma-70 factor (ECF subfamily)
VFFDLWRRAQRLRTHSAAATTTASTWLLAIASAKVRAIRTERAGASAAVRQIRGRQTHGRLSGQIVPMRARGQALRRALDGLSAEQREVIDLVYYHRRSVAEVGEIIAAPDAVVQARMEQARRKLAELARVG